jgi:putative membrane protein
MLTASEHEQVAAAVAKADAGTSGEILCVLAAKVSNYRETPLAWAAAAALLLPPLALVFGVHGLVLSALGADWGSGTGASVESAVLSILSLYAAAQIATFAVVAAVIAAVKPLKSALTPKALKQRRVHQAAMAQLMATRLLGSSIGAAVVIFASLQDRMVVVVADEAIHSKVGEAAWNKAVARVLAGIKSGQPASGFIEAVDLCGALLAEHFPVDGAVHTHLADGLLEL